LPQQAIWTRLSSAQESPHGDLGGVASYLPGARTRYWLVMLAAVAVISKVLIPVLIALTHTSVTVVAAAPIGTGERATNVAEFNPAASGPNEKLTLPALPAGLVKWQLP
jgi:hypothetical protein